MISRLVLTAAFAVLAFSAVEANAATKKAAKPAPSAALPAASPEQMQASEGVLTGRIPCELGQAIEVNANAKNKGYVDVKVAGVTYVTKPAYTDSGALRMEDTKGGIFMVQLADSSMVFNKRSGQRAAAQCRHAKQQAFYDSLPK
jgi:hypothetical protein